MSDKWKVRHCDCPGWDCRTWVVRDPSDRIRDYTLHWPTAIWEAHQYAKQDQA